MKGVIAGLNIQSSIKPILLFDVRQNSKKSDNVYGYYLDSYAPDATDLSKNSKESILKVLNENLKDLKEDLQESELKYSKYSPSERGDAQVDAIKYKIKFLKQAVKQATSQISMLN